MIQPYKVELPTPSEAILRQHKQKKSALPPQIMHSYILPYFSSSPLSESLLSIF